MVESCSHDTTGPNLFHIWSKFVVRDHADAFSHRTLFRGLRKGNREFPVMGGLVSSKIQTARFWWDLEEKLVCCLSIADGTSCNMQLCASAHCENGPFSFDVIVFLIISWVFLESSMLDLEAIPVVGCSNPTSVIDPSQSENSNSLEIKPF